MFTTEGAGSLHRGGAEGAGSLHRGGAEGAEELSPRRR